MSTLDAFYLFLHKVSSPLILSFFGFLPSSSFLVLCFLWRKLFSQPLHHSEGSIDVGLVSSSYPYLEFFWEFHQMKKPLKVKVLQVLPHVCKSDAYLVIYNVLQQPSSGHAFSKLQTWVSTLWMHYLVFMYSKNWIR